MSEFPALDALESKRAPAPKKDDGDERGLLTDVPLQVIGGVRDATQQVLDLLGLGGPRTGLGISQMGDLPEVDAPDTTTGALTRGIAQFATGFIPAFKALNAGKTAIKVASYAKSLGLSKSAAKAMGIFGTSEIAAQISDQVVFDPRSNRLSDLIESVPSLANPITAYLKSDPKDTEAEARFKVALEGAGLGAMIGSFIPIFRHMRANKVSRDLDKAFESAKKTETASISKETEDIAGKTSPADILEKTEQGKRPFINNKYLDTSEDIENTLNAVSRVFKKTIDSARRGRMSEGETKRLAEQLGMTVEELTSRRKGQAFNAEEALAARYVLNQSSNQVTRLARAAADPATNTEITQLAFHKSLARHAAIQESVMGIKAEAGRALRSMRIPAGVPDQAKAIQELLENVGKGVDRDKLAGMVAMLDTPEGIAKFSRLIHKPKWKDMVMEAWINSLLSGPTTQAVNITSNTLVALWTIPENLLAATIGAIRQSDERIYFREIPARVFGMWQGAKDGLRLAAKTFITEQPSDLLTKIELNRFQSIPSKTFREGAEKKVFGGVPLPFSGEIVLGGKQLRIPGRALQAGDEFFKSVGYRMELNALAMRSGLKKGLSGDDLTKHIAEFIDNPPKNVRIAALDNARYQTFTRELGTAGKSLQAIAARHPAARVIMPFIRTPANIVKFAAERSPFGLTMDSVKKSLKAGGAARDIAQARIYMGSAVGVGVASLALEGTITGGGPKDRAERAAMYNAGWRPYSVRIGDDYYAYNRLEPLGMILGISADFAEIAQASTGVEADEIGAMLVGSISKNLTSKTWLRGLSELILAVEDPERYGDNYIRRLASTVVPTGVAQIANIQDPVMREASSIIEQIKSRIPGQSETLLPKRNVWGEPIQRGGALGPDIISPVYTSTLSNDPVAREVARLNLGINRPDRVVRGVELTDKQYDEYVRVSGTIAKRTVLNYVKSPAWKSIPDYMKKDIIKKAMTKARSAARIRLLPEIAPQILQNRRAELEGK